MKKRMALLMAAMMLVVSVGAGCSKKEETKKKKKVTKKTTEEVEDTSDEETDTTKETTEAPQTVNGDFQPEITFSITDRDGNQISESVFAENKLTMINFWEPWCGPCVEEMPELEKIYEEYKDQGFAIIGVYSTEGMEEDVESVLADAGITYPICFYTSAFDPFQTGYVPTTIFVDQNGHVIDMSDGEKTVVGSKDYNGWMQIIKQYI
ncbi:MAG: TlpA family protein disulfide reductase [Clostridiales bacterium]|nr:TlpA family protein disulfide reductase [Clostridiales bacterium]